MIQSGHFATQPDEPPHHVKTLDITSWQVADAQISFAETHLWFKTVDDWEWETGVIRFGASSAGLGRPFRVSQ